MIKIVYTNSIEILKWLNLYVELVSISKLHKYNDIFINM